ncbi:MULTISPECIES: hypothetical protein [unclassified Rhizobacter]|uniref:hypothetical protein n=1 Tax=unclassified Rhizobacter TaxID=2640088 RepID=UPI0012FCE05D|nr:MULTISPECIES: hypothetical protein [unclassified Rhizobacter]
MLVLTGMQFNSTAPCSFQPQGASGQRPCSPAVFGHAPPKGACPVNSTLGPLRGACNKAERLEKTITRIKQAQKAAGATVALVEHDSRPPQPLWNLWQQLCKTLDDLNDALHPSWNLLPVAQAQTPDEVCAVRGTCDGGAGAAHPSIDHLKAFTSDAFKLRESLALKRRPDRSLDGVVILVADSDHYSFEVQRQIEAVVDQVYRADDLHFIEFPDEQLDREPGLCRGIPRRQGGRHGGSVGIDSAELRAGPLAVQAEQHVAMRARLGRLGKLLKLPDRKLKLQAPTPVELIALRREWDVEAERPENAMKLRADGRYMSLLKRERELSTRYVEALASSRDARSRFMAGAIASQVHDDAAASADPAWTYIAAVGASHIDEMVAELKRRKVKHYLVLCPRRWDGHGEVCR